MLRYVYHQLSGTYPFWELMSCWCLRRTGEIEKPPFCFHDYHCSQESNKSEETVNWMEHCERRDATARDCFTGQRSQIRTFQWLSNFFISSVNSRWARATSFHLAASYFFLEVRGQIPPVPHRSTARANGSKHRDIMLHYAEWARRFCWAVALMMYQCFTDSHSIKRSYTVGIQHWCLCFLSAWNLKCP